MSVIHMIFVRKDTHIKYLFAMIICQKNSYKRMLPLRARVMDLFDNLEEKHH